MPRDRIDIFTENLTAICADAGIPPFDEALYDEPKDTLAFIWHDPDFCLAAPLASASIYGLNAPDLRAAWDRKLAGKQAA